MCFPALHTGTEEEAVSGGSGHPDSEDLPWLEESYILPAHEEEPDHCGSLVSQICSKPLPALLMSHITLLTIKYFWLYELSSLDLIR